MCVKIRLATKMFQNAEINPEISESRDSDAINGRPRGVRGATEPFWKAVYIAGRKWRVAIGDRMRAHPGPPPPPPTHPTPPPFGISRRRTLSRTMRGAMMYSRGGDSPFAEIDALLRRQPYRVEMDHPINRRVGKLFGRATPCGDGRNSYACEIQRRRRFAFPHLPILVGEVDER